MSQTVFYLPVKQGRDEFITIRPKSNGVPVSVGWQVTDTARLQLFEDLNGEPVGELTSERHIKFYPKTANSDEYMTIELFGEETIDWNLKAAKRGKPLEPIPATFVNGERLLPTQELAGTLFITDQTDADRPLSGTEVNVMMEIALYRQQETEIPDDESDV